MKINHIIPLCALLLAGCSSEREIGKPSIVLGVDGLGQGTRAVVDGWDNTPVSVAYAFGAEDYTKAFNATVVGTADKHVNTGMAYPAGDVPAHFVGYHPVEVPDAMGQVIYDISNGDVDLMLSNEISGTHSVPITDKLNFEHKLTRITFEMNCKAGSPAYPEPILGVFADNAVPTKSLMTRAKIDLNTRAVSFLISTNRVFAGGLDGKPVPPAGSPPLVIDAMVQPDVPLKFTVLTLSGEQDITISNPTHAAWLQLINNGGEAGKRYVIKLSFSGIGILDFDGISVVDWETGASLGETGIWW